jgi:hypothetical protein
MRGLARGRSGPVMENPQTMGVDCTDSIEVLAEASSGVLPVPHHRNLRKRAVRARSAYRFSKRKLALATFDDRDVDDLRRPATRAVCAEAQRPCPYVSCEHHLYLEATKTGAILFRFPDLEPWELTESCALDVADRQGQSAEEVAGVLNLTRERVRQLEVAALAKLRAQEDLEELRGGFEQENVDW